MLWLLPGLSLKSAGSQLARPNLANMSGQRALIGLGCVSLASLAQMAGLGGMARRAWPIGRDRAGRHCATAWAPRYPHPADATCVRKKNSRTPSKVDPPKNSAKVSEDENVQNALLRSTEKGGLSHMAVRLPAERLQTLSKSEALQSEWVAFVSPDNLPNN